jgi:hypothetical protein
MPFYWANAQSEQKSLIFKWIRARRAKGGPLAEERAFKAKTPQAKMGMQT